MVGQLKIAVAQSLQSPGHTQPLLDQPFQLPHRCVGAAMEAKLRARQGVDAKVNILRNHTEMVACIYTGFTDGVQRMRFLSRFTIRIVTIAERQTERQQAHTVSRVPSARASTTVRWVNPTTTE